MGRVAQPELHPVRSATGSRSGRSTLWGEKGYAEQLEAFLTAIREGRPAEVTALDGARATIGCLAMLESAPAVHNIDAILAVPGLAGVIVGAADLSASLGHLGDPGHDEVAKAIDAIFQGCAAADVPFGMFAATREEADVLIRRQARIITVGSDLVFLERAMDQAVRDFSGLGQAPAPL